MGKVVKEHVKRIHKQSQRGQDQGWEMGMTVVGGEWWEENGDNLSSTTTTTTTKEYQLAVASPD